jgi:flagellar basal body-associated protein FliL
MPDTDTGSGGGTAIVIIIAILIIIIPLGFIISCIVKKIRERNNKDKSNGSVPLPDNSQNVSSPDRALPGGMYPFSSPADDSENMQHNGY